MGHAHHFLSRLDRVSLPHVELALSLYRDDALLRYILASVRLPEAAPRAAISLGDPLRGPFLVVTRDGHFVTCLGEGMSPGDLPIVPRGQLDGLAARVGELRARMAACKSMIGRTGGAGKLLARIHEAGNELSREELIALSGLQPLLAIEMFHMLSGALMDVLDTRKILVKQLRRSDHLKPALREIARSFWRSFWSIGHLSLLAALEGPALLERLPPSVADSMTASVSYSWGAVRQGITGLALKGVWGVARLGKALLPMKKQGFHKAATLLTVLDSGLGLAALGTRHARFRAEVGKVLEAGLSVSPGTSQGALLVSLVELLSQTFRLGHEDPEELLKIQRTVGRAAVVYLTKGLPPGAAYRFEHPEDVPDELALPMACNVEQDFLVSKASPQGLLHLCAAVPWVARAAPEDLYLPRDFIRAIRGPFQLGDVEPLLLAHRDYYARAACRPSGPARKGPCPCGSGKKYKRCCGAAASAEEDASAEEEESDGED